MKPWIRVACVLPVLLLVIVGLLVIRGNLPPEYPQHPSLPVPVPNAFDQFNKTYSSFHDLNKVKKSVHYAYMQPPDRACTLVGLTDAEAAHIDVENQPGLAMLRKALQEQYCAPQIHSFSQHFLYLGYDRSMATMICFDARIAAKQANWQRVIGDSLDCVAFGDKVEHPTPMIPKLVGNAMSKMGRETTWEAISHLNSSQAAFAAKRMEVLTDSRSSFTQTLIDEEFQTEYSMVYVLRQPFPTTQIDGRSPGVVGMLQNYLYFTMHPRTSSMADYRDYMKDEEQLASVGYQQATRKGDPTMPNDIFCQIICPQATKLLLKDTEDVAFDRLLFTALALRAYELDHNGSYPTSLAGLTPRYLNQVPVDPFDPTQGPLTFRCNAKSYVLYSKGPDGIDDGGKPILGHTSAGHLSRIDISATDKGDMVAGINCG